MIIRIALALSVHIRCVCGLRFVVHVSNVLDLVVDEDDTIAVFVAGKPIAVIYYVLTLTASVALLACARECVADVVGIRIVDDVT